MADRSPLHASRVEVEESPADGRSPTLSTTSSNASFRLGNDTSAAMDPATVGAASTSSPLRNLTAAIRAVDDTSGSDPRSQTDDETNFSDVDVFSDVGLGDTDDDPYVFTVSGAGDADRSGLAAGRSGSFTIEHGGSPTTRGASSAAAAAESSSLRPQHSFGGLASLRKMLANTAIGVSSRPEPNEYSAATPYRNHQGRRSANPDAWEMLPRGKQLWHIARRLRLMLRFCMRLTIATVNPIIRPIHRLVSYLGAHPTDRFSDTIAAILAASVDPKPTLLTSGTVTPPRHDPLTSPEALHFSGSHDPGSGADDIARSTTASMEVSTRPAVGTSLSQSANLATNMMKADASPARQPSSTDVAEVIAAARAITAEVCKSADTLRLLRAGLRRSRTAAVGAASTSVMGGGGGDDSGEEDDPDHVAVTRATPPESNVSLVVHHMLCAVTNMAMLGGIASLREAGFELEIAKCVRAWPLPSAQALIDMNSAVQRHAVKLAHSVRNRIRRQSVSSRGSASSSPSAAGDVKHSSINNPLLEQQQAAVASVLLGSDGKHPAPLGLKPLNVLLDTLVSPGRGVDLQGHAVPDQRAHAQDCRLAVARVVHAIVDGLSRTVMPGSGTSRSGSGSSSTAGASAPPSFASLADASAVHRPSDITAAGSSATFPAASKAAGKHHHKAMPHVALVRLIYNIAESTLQHAVADAPQQVDPGHDHDASFADDQPRVSFVEDRVPARSADRTLTAAAAAAAQASTPNRSHRGGTTRRSSVDSSAMGLGSAMAGGSAGAGGGPHQQAMLPGEATVNMTQALESLSILPEGSYWGHVPPPQTLISRLLDLLVWWPTADPVSQSVAFLLQQLPPTTFFADVLARKAPHLSSLLESNFVPATAAVTLLRSVSAIVTSEAPAVQSFGRQMSAPSSTLRTRALQALSVYESVNDVLAQSASTLAGMIRASDQVVPGEPAALATTAKAADSAEVVDAAVNALVTAASSTAFGGWSAVSSDCSSRDVPLMPTFTKAMLAANTDRATLERVLAAMTAAAEAAPPSDVLGDPAVVAELVKLASEMPEQPKQQAQLLRCAASAASQNPSAFAANLETLRLLADTAANASGPASGGVIAAAADLARHSPPRRVAAVPALVQAVLKGLPSCNVAQADPALALVALGGAESFWVTLLANFSAASRVLLYASTATLSQPAACRVGFIMALCTPDEAAASMFRGNAVVAHLLDVERDAAEALNPLSVAAKDEVQRLRQLLIDIDDAADREARELREQIEALTRERDEAREGVKAAMRQVEELRSSDNEAQKRAEEDAAKAREDVARAREAFEEQRRMMFELEAREASMRTEIVMARVDDYATINSTARTEQQHLFSLSSATALKTVGTSFSAALAAHVASGRYDAVSEFVTVAHASILAEHRARVVTEYDATVAIATAFDEAWREELAVHRRALEQAQETSHTAIEADQERSFLFLSQCSAVEREALRGARDVRGEEDAARRDLASRKQVERAAVSSATSRAEMQQQELLAMSLSQRLDVFNDVVFNSITRDHAEAMNELRRMNVVVHRSATERIDALNNAHALERRRLTDDHEKVVRELEGRASDAERQRDSSKGATLALENDVAFLRDTVKHLGDQHDAAAKRADGLVAELQNERARFSTAEKSHNVALAAAEKTKTEFQLKAQDTAKSLQLLERRVEQMKGEATNTQRRMEHEAMDLRKQLAEARSDVAQLRGDLSSERERHHEDTANYRAQIESFSKLAQERDAALAVHGTLATEIQRLQAQLAAANTARDTAEKREGELSASKDEVDAHSGRLQAELNQQLVRNQMMLQDIQIMVARLHELEVEGEYLGQHNLIAPDLPAEHQQQSKSRRRRGELPSDLSESTVAALSPAPGNPQPSSGDVQHGDEVTQTHVDKCVAVARDLTGLSNVTDLRVDPTAHPKDGYIVKLIASLRSTSKLLQTVFVTAEHDRTARKLAEARLVQQSAVLRLARQQQSSSNDMPSSVVIAATPGVASESRARRKITAAAQHGGSGSTGRDAGDADGTTTTAMSKETLYLAARHASRSVHRLTEAVAVQHRLTTEHGGADHHADASHETRLVAVSDHHHLESSRAVVSMSHANELYQARPVSPTGDRLGQNGSAASVGPSRRADESSARRPSFELSTAPTRAIARYSRESDPHLRDYLDRRARAKEQQRRMLQAKRAVGRVRPSSAGAAGRKETTSFGFEMDASEVEPVEVHADAPPLHLFHQQKNQKQLAPASAAQPRQAFAAADDNEYDTDTDAAAERHSSVASSTTA